MKKWFMMILTIVSTIFVLGELANAATIFQDNFDRPPYPNNIIGNGWTKTFNQNNDVQLRARAPATDPNNGILWLRDINASVTHQDSTAGFRNISISFDWRGNANADSTDFLRLSWSDGINAFDSGLLLPLDTQILTTTIFDLPPAAANLPGFSIKFFTDVDSFDEAARLQQVTLTGDPVPVPTTLLLLGSGLLVLLGAKSRKFRNGIASH